MVSDHALGLAYRGEVVRPVPFFQQRDVGQQFLLRYGVDLEAQGADATGERRPERHADNFSGLGRASLNPRFRCTSNSEIAAGVTPEMRAAWPMVSGRCWFNFCCTSIESPRTNR